MAALGDRNKAFTYLNIAVYKGWTNIELTKRCIEFQIFHETKERKNLLARFEGKGQE